MSQQEPEKVIHLLRVGQKSLKNTLSRIQWPVLSEKQHERVQRTCESVSKLNKILSFTALPFLFEMHGKEIKVCVA